MKIIGDLHIHSKYAQATSKNMDLSRLEEYARIKGIDLLGTGDFTHPKWIEELKSGLTDQGNGIFKSATGYPFVLQTELSLAYTHRGKGRRVHHLVFAPSFDVIDQITEWLLTKGRVDYDGRPIFGIQSTEFVEKLHSISPQIEVVPAHAWTPWFGVLGSKSGYDSLSDCFEDQMKHIHAIETGMSSDPAMNWRVPELDNITLLSNSDLHSYWPWRMGREANVFDFKELSYENILKAIRTREGLVETIEVDPGYGKYHIDGHRNCNVAMEPSETKKHNGICPVCKKELTRGVLGRVEELAQREEGFVLTDSPGFKTIIPLTELIVAVHGSSLATKKTWAVYNEIIKLGSEYHILLNSTKEELLPVAGERLTEIILLNREGKIEVKPGYDGEYGVPQIGEIREDEKKDATHPQKGLGDFIS